MPATQATGVAAVIPAFLMPANVGDQTLRLPVPGFLGSPAALMSPPAPPLPIPPLPATENVPVPAGLRALSNTMRAWDRPIQTAAVAFAEPVFHGREEHSAKILFPQNGTSSSDGPVPARCESLEILDPPPFCASPAWQSPAVAGANALQFVPEPRMAVPPTSGLQLEPGAFAAASDQTDPDLPVFADLQPFPAQLKPFLVASQAAIAAEQPAPVFWIPAAEFPDSGTPGARIDAQPQALPFCGLRPIDPRPTQSWNLPPISFLEVQVDPELSGFQSGSREASLPEPLELAPLAEPFSLHLAPLRPLALALLPKTVPNGQALPYIRGYWPWPSPATPAGRPVLGVMQLEMDSAVLKAVEPPKALVLAQRPDLMVRPAPPPAEPEPEILIPIVESATPPMARLVPLPKVGVRPRSVFLRPGRVVPTPEFPLGEPYVPQRRSARLIPSPIYDGAKKKSSIFSSSSPGWLITAAIALLIPMGALGVVNYWILPAQRASAASAPSQSSSQAPASTVRDGAAGDALPANWKKVVEITGIRLQDGRAQYIVVNHGKAPIPSTMVLVTLRSASAAAKGLPPVGSFQVRLAPLAPKESREMSSAIQMAPVSNTSGDVDWTDIRAELQLVK
jgi:hypothetical protein